MVKYKFPPKTIVLGGSGMVGYYIDESVPNYDLANNHDLTNPRIIKKIFEKEKPAHVIHLAAVTDVTGAEDMPSKCFDTTASMVYWVANACKKHKARMYFISSVDIFDGTKEGPYDINDDPNPIVVYGHSKLAAEGIIQRVLPDAIVLRAGWMFGGIKRDKKFVSYMVNFLKEGKPLKAVNDIMGSPTFAQDLVKLISELTEDYGISGIHHACNAGVASRYDQARVIAEEWNKKSKTEVNVTGVLSSAFPNFRALKNSTMIQSFPIRNWEVALREYIRDWRQLEGGEG